MVLLIIADLVYLSPNGNLKIQIYLEEVKRKSERNLFQIRNHVVYKEKEKERVIFRLCVLAPPEGLESDELQASICE
jgi:hypothetical protein